MDNLRFNTFREALIEEANTLSDGKSIEYTQSSDDKLANFKNIGKRFNIDPLAVAGIYMNKHVDSINNYIKTGKISSGESLKSRLIDIINYSILMIAIEHEKNNDPKQSGVGTSSSRRDG
jgi:hypothetical protein